MQTESIRMRKLAKLLVTGLLLYFFALCLYILHANIPLAFNKTGLEDQKAMIELIRKYPFSGTWASNSTSNSLLKSNEGKLDVLYTSFHSVKSSGSADENKQVLRLILYDPKFSDEPNVELLIRRDQVSETEFIGEISGTFSGLKHSKFTSATFSNFLIKLTETKDIAKYSRNYLDIDQLKNNKVTFSASLEFSGDVEQTFELNFSFSGYSIAAKLLLYSTICVVLFGVNLYCSANILVHLLEDVNYANLMSVHTVYMTVCQHAFLFVFHIVIGISLSNNVFLMISAISGGITLINILILMRGWISNELEEAEESANTQRSLQKFFLHKVLLTTAGLLFIYLNMRYFLEPWTLGLNACILLPQIIQNIKTRVPAQFSLKYLVGLASSPLFVLIYLRGSSHNPIQIRYSYTWPYYILAGWAFTLFLIKIQSLFYSEVILPFFLRSNYHNYFIRKTAFSVREPLYKHSTASSEEMGLQTMSSMRELNTSDTNPGEICSVCQDKLLNSPPSMPSLKKSESSASEDSGLCKKYPKQIFRDYLMLTPCSHQFHSECLLEWMQVKMACPICRCTLPPLE